MTESNNVTSFSDFKKNSKHPEYGKGLTANTSSDLENQPLMPRQDEYKTFVTAPANINKIEFLVQETMKNISSQYPEIATCRYGDVLFLKEALVSLIMRAALNQDHPFQRLADGLEKAYHEITTNE